MAHSPDKYSLLLSTCVGNSFIQFFELSQLKPKIFSQWVDEYSILAGALPQCSPLSKTVNFYCGMAHSLIKARVVSSYKEDAGEAHVNSNGAERSALKSSEPTHLTVLTKC